MSAKARKFAAALGTSSLEAREIGFPVSATSAATKQSKRDSIASATLRKRAARSCTLARSHSPAKAFASTLYCAIDDVPVRFADLRDHASVRRIHIRELTLARDKLSINVVLDELHVVRTPRHPNSPASAEAIAERISYVALPDIDPAHPSTRAFRCRTGAGSLPTEPNTPDAAPDAAFAGCSPV